MAQGGTTFEAALQMALDSAPKLKAAGVAALSLEVGGVRVELRMQEDPPLVISDGFDSPSPSEPEPNNYEDALTRMAARGVRGSG